MGYEISRPPGLVKMLDSRKINLVLDVGANVGQFGQELRERGYKGHIVSFEPTRSAFDNLTKVAAADGAWEAYNFALGSVRGQATIKVSENTVFSSMLPQTPAAERFDASSKVLREEIVEVQRIDDIFARFARHNVFLKIDTQGFEREVLQGAEQSLNEILGVQLELPIVHLYKGVWLLPELHERKRVCSRPGASR